ncbi:hypothetical protein R2A130_3347 [Ahrensia sp. R2A130]|nr:hypothetical protein R2A130_3347 [Ahrensia sp. R2A130]
MTSCRNVDAGRICTVERVIAMRLRVLNYVKTDAVEPHDARSAAITTSNNTTIKTCTHIQQTDCKNRRTLETKFQTNKKVALSIIRKRKDAEGGIDPASKVVLHRRSRITRFFGKLALHLIGLEAVQQLALLGARNFGDKPGGQTDASPISETVSQVRAERCSRYQGDQRGGCKTNDPVRAAEEYRATERGYASRAPDAEPTTHVDVERNLGTNVGFQHHHARAQVWSGRASPHYRHPGRRAFASECAKLNDVKQQVLENDRKIQTSAYRGGSEAKVDGDIRNRSADPQRVCCQHFRPDCFQNRKGYRCVDPAVAEAGLIG